MLGIAEHCNDSVSIHAPKEGSDGANELTNGNGDVSIHAPKEGSDLKINILGAVLMLFQSTLPKKGATSFFLQVDRS